MKPVLAVGTMDSKGAEVAYVAACIRKTGVPVVMVDVGTGGPPASTPDVTREAVAAKHPEGAQAVLECKDRGEAVTAMSRALVKFVEEAADRYSGIIGVGGSGGTALITPAMQALPVGFPKVMVSTMASGNVAAYVGCTDITMMYSVADIAGINRLSSVVLGNAASAVAGMVKWPPARMESKEAVAITMFGVTTPCCEAVRAALENTYDVVTFHATGSGGQAMEKLVESGLVAGVLDLTTTEVADEVVGGVLTAGPRRIEAAMKAGTPCVMSLGALDMVNFGGKDTVPERFRERKLHVHNEQVTLMRTTPEENRLFAAFIAGKVNESTGPFVMLIPERGISIIDVPDMPFHDPEADAALFEEVEKLVQQTATRRLRRLPYAINDPEFAAEAVKEFLAMMPAAPTPSASAETTARAGGDAAAAGAAVLPSAAPGPRDGALAKLRATLAAGKPIVGGGAGTGISAKFEEAGGVDLIIVYNSGRFRMGGHGSLAGMMPFKDANAIMLEMGEEILPVLKSTPLLAGVCGTDPFRRMDRLLAQVKELGFVGVQNFPTVGLIDGNFRQNLEETNMGYQKEVDMIALAHSMGLLTTPYCFSAADARLMASVGADIVVAHMGLTTKGSIGAATALTLDESVALTQEIADAARSVNPEVMVLVHGGPVAMPEDAQYVLSRCKGVDGFYGASSMERLPVETAITEQTRQFKALSLPR